MVQFDEPETWDHEGENGEAPRGDDSDAELAGDLAGESGDDPDADDDEPEDGEDEPEDEPEDGEDEPEDGEDEPEDGEDEPGEGADEDADDAAEADGAEGAATRRVVVAAADDEDEDEEIDAFDTAEPDDIEDEFADFVDEEMGYADIDWDSIPQKQVDEHDRIRALANEALSELDLKRANDLFRWAAARAFLEHGDDTAFEDLAAKLLESKKRSKALDYVDIALALMARQVRRVDFDAAFATLEKLADVSKGDTALVERFRGILTIQKGERNVGLEKLASLAETKPDDADFLLSLGEDLCGIGLWEPALEYLEIAEELARAKADNDLLSSIENAAQFAQRHIAYDDVEDEA